MARRVLVSGLNGVVGRAVRPRLEEHYELVALSRSGVADLPPERVFKADVSDREAIKPAFAGVDTVVHLAADGGVSSQHGMAAPWDSMLRNNIMGTYNVFEAAQDAGVRRVIFASSGATIIGYEQESPYRELVQGSNSGAEDPWPMVTRESEPRPLSLYGVSKLFGEDLARYFVATSPLSIICLRIGGVNAENRPGIGRGRSIWCSWRDMAQMVHKCIEADDGLRFDIFYVTSKNRLGYRDLDHARSVVGFEPEDGAD